MSEGPLAGLRVLECAQGINGPYCGKLLADLGASVLKVEPPEGDVARRWGPFPGDVPHPEKSGLFLYLNSNKQGITLNLGTPQGQRLLQKLVTHTDILIENHPPPLSRELGLDFSILCHVNPALVMVSITPFGQTGPYRDYKATDLISFHMGGAGYETPQHGVESLELPPLRASGDQADFLTGIVAATATMAALFAREVSGQAQYVDLSEQEALVSIIARINLHQYTYEQQTPTRRRATQRLINHVPCKDGYVNILIYEPHWWQNLVQAMGNPEWAHDELFRNADFRAQGWDAVQPLIEAWAQEHNKEELFPLLQAHHVPCLPGNTFQDVANYHHLHARGFFVELHHPALGKVLAPGAPYRFSQTPWALRRPAPMLGQDNEDVYGRGLGYATEDLVRLRARGVL